MQSERVSRGSGREVRIAVWNKNHTLSDRKVEDVVMGALQTQLVRDLYPAWGVRATLEFTRLESRPCSGRWRLILLDDRHNAVESGFHELTNEGLPQALVFVGKQQKNEKQQTDGWTLSASHELLEMLIGPDLNQAAVARLPDVKKIPKTIASKRPFPDSNEVFCALEVCDPCAAAENGYRINGTLLSDFDYPAWFQSFHSRTKRTLRRVIFDHKRHIDRPFPSASRRLRDCIQSGILGAARCGPRGRRIGCACLRSLGNAQNIS